VAETLNNLANVLQQQGDLPAAKEAHERALKIKEAAFGADSLPVRSASRTSRRCCSTRAT
jgi:hypothetical protein